MLRGSDADNLAVLVDNTGKSSLSYTDSTVTAETTYAYAIRARNADGLSTQSDAVSTTTQAAPVLPAKPTGLLPGRSHDRVLMFWDDPGDDSITGYQILRGDDADSLTVLTNDTGSASASYTDDDVDDDDEYMDLAFGRMPDAFVTEDTGYRLGGDSRAGFRRPANQSRVWFNDNEFTEVEVTDSTNRSLTLQMRVTFADAELEAKEGLYEIGTVATVRVQLSRPRNKESRLVIPITVNHHGGAAPGVDYDAGDVPSSITFLPGQTEYSFRVRAVNDDIDDDDEYLTLSFGTLPELVYAGDQSNLRIDLVDDDDPPVEVFFEQAKYEVTSVSQDENTEYARLEVKVKLSAAPERFIDVGIVPESIQGNGDINFEYSAYIPRGPHSGAHFYSNDTEFTLIVYMSAVGEFDSNQTFRLSFEGMSYRMSVGSPATATITIQDSS